MIMIVLLMLLPAGVMTIIVMATVAGRNDDHYCDGHSGRQE